jgi:hypothetical protein
MPYLSRLMEDTGLTFPEQSVPAAARVATPDTPIAEGPLEGDETLLIARPVPPSPAPPAVPLATLADRPEATPVERTVGPQATDAAPAPPQAETPVETPSEYALRSLAIVHDWTAATPAREESVTPAPEVSTRLEEDAVTFTAATAPRNQVRAITREVHAATPETLPAAASQLDAQAADTMEPEVVNVSLSIGAIELTLEAPPATARPVQSEVRVPRPGIAAPDAAARLRRHYYRLPIG